MKRIAIAVAIAAIAAAGPVAAKAKHHSHAAAKAGVEVTERDAKGRPTKVRMDGQEVSVCTADKTDGCVNPREAGLNFGNNPIGDWPGKPASDKH